MTAKHQYGKINSILYETGSLITLHRQYCHKIFSQLDLRIEDGGRAIDAGCGGGRLAIALKKELNKRNINAVVNAFDISEEMLRKAEKRARRKKLDIKLYQADGQNLSYAKEFRYGKSNGRVVAFKDNSIDLVVSSGLLECVSDPDKTLEEMIRILKPGGQLILSFVNRNLLGKAASRMPRFKFNVVPKEYFKGDFEGINDFEKVKIKSFNLYMKTLKSVYTGTKVHQL